MALTKVSTPAIKDEAITLAKLLHGDSNSNGKFLRANNGADPTFETVNTDLVSDTSPQLGGNLSTNSNAIHVLDNDRIYVGTGYDMEIYHDGSTSYIRGGSANIDIRAVDGEQSIVAKAHNAVELYYDGSKKFETTANGIIATGNDATGNILIGDLRLKQTSGDTTYIKWDASHSKLEFIDNVYAMFGNANDLQIYHDGTHSYIYSDNGELKNRAAIWKAVNEANSEKMIEATENGSVDLYYDNTKRFETISSGVKVTGNIDQPNVNSYILGSGHNVIQTDATRTYFYGGTNGIQLRTADNAGALLYVDNSGNVGINGVADTLFKLDVVGAARIGNGIDGLIIENAGSNAAVSNAANIRRHSSTGNLHITAGTTTARNLIIGTKTNGAEIARFTSHGLCFNGDTADANALDEYEEGTFTPQLKFGGNFNGSYSTQTGYYTRIGRLVTFSFRITLSSKGSNTGNAQVFGLPFNVKGNDAAYSAATFGWLQNMANLQRWVCTQIPTLDTNNSYVFLRRFETNLGATAVAHQHDSFSDSSDFILQGLYVAD